MIRQILLEIIRWVRRQIREKFHSQNEDLPYYVTIVIAAILSVIALNGFLELTDELAENDLTGFDETVTEYVLSFRSDALTSYFVACTHLGDRYAYIAVIVLLAGYYFFRKRSWQVIVQTTIVLALATLSNVVIKRIVNRARPELEHLVTVNTLSYPSGHSMSAMAFYGFLIYLCLRYEVNRYLRVAVVVALSALILSIGVSRIYLGVHFPSDVVAGFIGGFIWVTFCAVLFNLLGLWRRKRKADMQEV